MNINIHTHPESPNPHLQTPFPPHNSISSRSSFRLVDSNPPYSAQVKYVPVAASNASWLFVFFLLRFSSLGRTGEEDGAVGAGFAVAVAVVEERGRCGEGRWAGGWKTGSFVFVSASGKTAKDGNVSVSMLYISCKRPCKFPSPLSLPHLILLHSTSNSDILPCLFSLLPIRSSPCRASYTAIISRSWRKTQPREQCSPKSACMLCSGVHVFSSTVQGNTSLGWKAVMKSQSSRYEECRE